VLPQNSDFDAGSVAVLIPTKHNMAKTKPTRNANPYFLPTLNILPVILEPNQDMNIIYQGIEPTPTLFRSERGKIQQPAFATGNGDK